MRTPARLHAVPESGMAAALVAARVRRRKAVGTRAALERAAGGPRAFLHLRHGRAHGGRSRRRHQRLPGCARGARIGRSHLRAPGAARFRVGRLQLSGPAAGFADAGGDGRGEPGIARGNLFGLPGDSAARHMGGTRGAPARGPAHGAPARPAAAGKDRRALRRGGAGHHGRVYGGPLPPPRRAVEEPR